MKLSYRIPRITKAANTAVMRVFFSVVMAIPFVAAITAVVVMAVPESAAAVMAAASPVGAAWTALAAKAIESAE